MWKSVQTRFRVKVRTKGQFSSNDSVAEKVSGKHCSDMSLADINRLYDIVAEFDSADMFDDE